ncbi:MAG: BlaI/MecI/CopY family transcriptional regulator [Gemmatimonadaceae bacterium]
MTTRTAVDGAASRQSLDQLGRRERQIMNVVYRLGRATVGDVLAQLDDPPSYSAVRTMLRYLEGKGYLRHEAEGRSFVYIPVLRASTAQRFALRELVRTFFGGSRARAVAALLEVPDTELSDEDLRRLRDTIAQADARTG